MLNFLCTKKQAVKSYFSAVALCLKSVVISEVGKRVAKRNILSLNLFKRVIKEIT